MASAGGGHLVSRDDYEDPGFLASMVAHDWFMDHAKRAREDLETCRVAATFPTVCRVNGERPIIEDAREAFVVAHVMRELDHAEALLADPAEYMGDDWDEDMAPEVALETAWRVIGRAWRTLLAAARTTRNARTLALITTALARVVSLRRRAAFRAPRPEASRPERSHLERRAPLISLTQAAHGPPAPGWFAMSPQLAGGGRL